MENDTPPSASAKFKSFVELLRDITTIVALAGAVVFFLSPSFERTLKETFGTKAWYFTAELKIYTELAEGADSGPIKFEARRNNFYHFLWSENNSFPGRSVESDAAAVDYFVSVLDRIKGDIVYTRQSDTLGPVPGRETTDVVSPVLTLAQQHECFRILDTFYRKGVGDYPHNIYLQMVQTPCH